MLGKRRSRRQWDDQVDMTRFVTGAQKTERHHIEAAFDTCLKTAKLTIEGFRNSTSDD